METNTMGPRNVSYGTPQLWKGFEIETVKFTTTTKSYENALRKEVKY